MALTRFSGDADVISQLSNQPNDNDGLSAAQLKARFDQYGTDFKEYFNNVFIPEVESAINAAAAGITPTGLSGAVIIDGTIAAEKLLSSPRGAEAVSTNVIRDGAVTKPKLATAVQNVLDEVPNKTVHSVVSAVLASDSWEDNTQTVTATGVGAANSVIVTAGIDDASHEAWSNCDIRAIAQDVNTLTFKARTVPSSDVNVNILILDQGG